MIIAIGNRPCHGLGRIRRDAMVVANLILGMALQGVPHRIRPKGGGAEIDLDQLRQLFIPKSKLKQLRRAIKVTVRGMPTGRSLADLIDSLNPLITAKIGAAARLGFGAGAMRRAPDVQTP